MDKISSREAGLYLQEYARLLEVEATRLELFGMEEESSSLRRKSEAINEMGATLYGLKVYIGD